MLSAGDIVATVRHRSSLSPSPPLSGSSCHHRRIHVGPREGGPHCCCPTPPPSSSRSAPPEPGGSRSHLRSAGSRAYCRRSCSWLASPVHTTGSAQGTTATVRSARGRARRCCRRPLPPPPGSRSAPPELEAGLFTVHLQLIRVLVQKNCFCSGEF